MSTSPVFSVTGFSAQKWNTTFDSNVKRVFPETMDDSEAIAHTRKRLCREDTNTTDTGHSEDTFVPHLKQQISESEVRKLEEEGCPYVRTKISKTNSTNVDSREESEESSEDGIGKDYIVHASPMNVKYSIEQKFLLEMPDDFFDMWECCSKINKDKPEEALKKAGLTLVGPYDILTGKLKQLRTRLVSSYVCHWRYYYDPPEFMTVIAGDENEYHIGYYRDDPFYMPIFVSSMSAAKPGSIKPLGGNIFAGVCSYLNQRMKDENPFKKIPLQRLHRDVESYARSHGYCLDAVTPDIQLRRERVFANTFHGAGMVLPGHDHDCIEIPENYDSLRQMLQKVADAKTEEETVKSFEKIKELITNAQSAYDDADYAIGLELGMNLFIFGGEIFHKAVSQLLGVAYDFLDRGPYVDIINAHLKNRRRGSNMSILEVLE